MIEINSLRINFFIFWKDNLNQHKWEMCLEDNENIRIKIINETYDGENISEELNLLKEYIIKTYYCDYKC
jgi:hypothetical protein